MDSPRGPVNPSILAPSHGSIDIPALCITPNPAPSETTIDSNSSTLQIPMRVLRQCLRLALYLQCGRNNQHNTLSLSIPYTAEDIPDGVSGPETDPLWDGTVLLLRSRELLLRAEGLVALCGKMGG